MADYYDYNTAIKRRLGAIDDLGSSATTWQRLKSQRDLQQQKANDNMAILNSQYQAAQQAGMNQQYLSGQYGSATQPVDRLVGAIKSQESSNNYNARNGMSGAMGAYQIMPSNLGGTKSGWDYEALGYDISPSQFMASPQLQDKIATFKLSQYRQRYGDAGAAIAWYAGESSAKKFVNGGGVSTRTEAGGYPSQSAYMNAILRKLGY